MTKRDFFVAFIKIVGLYSLILTVFSVIPYVFSFSSFNTGHFDIKYAIAIIILFIIIITIFLLLIFNADKIVKLLKLEKGWDDDYIKFGNFNSIEILKLGIVLLGGYYFIFSLSQFITQIIYLFKNNMHSLHMDNSPMQYDGLQWTLLIFDILIGFLLLTNFNWLANFLDKSTKES